MFRRASRRFLFALLFPVAVLAQGSGEAASRQELQGFLREGERLELQGKSAEAAKRFQGALALALRLSDRASTAASFFGLGKAHWGAGDYASALASHERALAIRQELGDAAGQAPVLNNIGLAYYGLSRYAEALEHYRRALEVNRLSPSAKLEGVVLMNIGLVYRYLGHYREAAGWMEGSLRVRRETGDKRAIGQTLNAMGLLERARGFYRKALERYAEALPLRREAGDRQGESQTLNGIGVVYFDQGQYEEAIEQYRQALAIAEEIGYTAQIGFSNLNIGVALSHIGRHREALFGYGDALAIWRRMQRRGDIARTLYDIGVLRLHLGDLDIARATLTEALGISREIGEPEPESRALDGMGLLELRSGRFREALELFDAALTLARSKEMPDIEWEVRADRARALTALGRNAEAIEELAASAKQINDLRANVGTDAGKIGFLDKRREVFDLLVLELTVAGRHAEALEAAEASRARAFADLLTQREMGRASDRTALEDLRSAFEEREAKPLVPEKGRAEPPALAGRRGSGGVDRALDELRKRDAELASLISVEAPTISEIRRAAARRGATLVEYHVTEDRLLLWVLRPGGGLHSASVPVGRERLRGLIQSLLGEIETADLAALRDPDSLRAPLRELDRLLIEPAARWLPSAPEEPVILLPDGPLALLPFAALVDSRGRTLAQRHTFSSVPAASVLRYTQAKSARAASGTQRALIVADPEPPRGAGLGRLPGSSEEASRVGARFRAANRLILTGARATEAAVKRATAGRTVLHFATHGLISDDRPLDSSLLFAEGEGEDGYLRVAEVFGLDLRADLVVLSGCSTGLGKLSGDGVQGLTRAFLYAGTPSVVVSRWDVSDRATAFFMDRFYSAIEAGRNKAQALRAAQLAARERFRHPALWAAFTLVGEP